ncbi:MAG TPA: Eco57I restriction-modification methylase domain-containing protein [Flavobacteriales bacterium]|nr:Eco57I restriction-modification methylase domain-containing protein [Flavobacteriales bacterium]
MKLITQTPKKALKAFLKQKPLRSEIDLFKVNLIALLDKIAVIEKQPKDESEEHLKNNLRDFLRDTYYRDTNAINTKDKKDLVIHLNKTTDSSVGVIIEAKRPTNVGEMLSAENPNRKALHELILYYLNERNSGNNELKQLVVTSINEWFIVDANYFDKFIYRNTQIKKLYDTKLNDRKDNPWFYEEIAKVVSKLDVEIPCTYFDIREFETVLRNTKKEDDKELIALFKILSPQHLLKITTPNDSNSLNERFYKELLHIIGLEEAKEGTKNIIRRKKENRNAASLIELTIEALKTEDTFHRIPDLKIYGENKEGQTFNIALELCITWINRILFLKLLEGQLIAYHQGNKDYRFLNSEMIHDFDELFKLFHKVLAVNIPDRTELIKNKYSRVPYLNSSLFEISDLEDQTIKINSLENDGELEFVNTTILKDFKRKANKLPTLEYLFYFLDAYDFASEGTEDVQEDNKTIINASVLGKVFEKINGYKDGSIFTPAFITMYMCRQSIRLAVVEKFNESISDEGKKLFDKYEDVKNYTSRLFKTQEILKANEVINSLRICDPAVGSGHFLVSALNEIIAVKAELGILADEKGNNLSGYEIEIVNDELIITDQQGNIVEYKLQNDKPSNKEIQRLQKALFHEKQTIIENCLFGVDINPKSVLICRLRLWIELLKNAYYKEPNYLELETLPNIDINIKCGNSLLSRFALDSDLSKALKSIKYDVKAYRGFVNDYKNEKSRDVKRGLQKIIDTIKSDFRTEILNNDPKVVRLRKISGELLNLLNQTKLFDEDSKQKKARKEKQQKLEDEIKKLTKQIEEIKTNAIYKNAFEWRFEFPEVLNNDGDFDGFDLIIGNPPYIKEDVNRDAFNGLRDLECYQGKMDLWYLFGDLGLKLLKQERYLCYIATNNWVTNSGASNFRKIVINNSQIVNLIDFGAYMIFENASIQTMIMLFKRDSLVDNYTFDYRRLEGDKLTQDDVLKLLIGADSKNGVILQPKVIKEDLIGKTLTFNSGTNSELLDKIKSKHNFFLREKPDNELKLQAEVGSGIDVLQDFVSKANVEKLNGKANVGDGVFVLSQEEYDNLKFSKKEKEIIKPYFTTEQLQKYSGNPSNQYWILYTKSDIGKPDKKTKKIPIDDYPKIKEHLDKFRSIITSDNKPYGLHRTREQHLFEGEKIFALRKCPKEPRFTYTDFDCFVSRAFLVIQSNRINLKYLTGLLNSRLIAFWLRKKGKMQGNAYQLDKEPLLEIPIHNPSEAEANKVAALVEKVISQRLAGKDSAENERKIDEMIYKLYDLTEQDIRIIEEN